MVSGIDDLGFVEERFFGIYWINFFGDKLFYGNNCIVWKNIFVNFVECFFIK